LVESVVCEIFTGIRFYECDPKNTINQSFGFKALKFAKNEFLDFEISRFLPFGMELFSKLEIFEILLKKILNFLAKYVWVEVRELKYGMNMLF
jgi:hypothetical protein